MKARSMESWANFWAAVIILALTAFAILAVVVTIGGWRDLMALLKRDSQPAEKDNPLRKK